MTGPELGKAVGVGLAALDATLVAIYLYYMLWLIDVSPIVRRLFDLNAEGTIAAYWSSAKLLVCGALFIVAGRSALRSAAGFAGFLVLVGCGFVFLSADEALGIHEAVTRLLRPVEGLPRFAGDHGIWIPLYGLIGVGMLAATARHWVRLREVDPRGTLWLIAGAAAFVAGGVGLEILSYDEPGQAVRRLSYTLLIASEEGLELAGATAMLVGAMHIRASVQARVVASSETTPH